MEAQTETSEGNALANAREEVSRVGEEIMRSGLSERGVRRERVMRRKAERGG